MSIHGIEFQVPSPHSHQICTIIMKSQHNVLIQLAELKTTSDCFKPQKFRYMSCLLMRLDLGESEDGEALAQIPREAVDFPSLELFQARLDGAGSNLGM